MIDFDMDIFEAFEEAHAALLYHRNHDGSAYCECKVALFLREFEDLYRDRLFTERKRRSRERKKAARKASKGLP